MVAIHSLLRDATRLRIVGKKCGFRILARCFFGIAASAAHAAPMPIQPTFLARYLYIGCSSLVNQVTSGDVNGDGIPDLVCSDSNDVLTFFGNGDGTFRPGPISSPGFSGVNSPLLVDLNGDGKMDLMVATLSTSGTGGIAVCFGNGDGTFQPGTFYQAGTDQGAAPYIVAGDFNGDGILDFAIQEGSGVWLFTGKGAGTFNQGALTPVTQSGGGLKLAPSDLNGDGKLDLVVTIYDGFAVLLGNGDGTFQPQVDMTVPYDGFTFALGDFTSDGNVDLFATSGDYDGGHAYLYTGNGHGEFTLAHQVNNSAYPETVSAVNLNGDNFLDIVTSSGGVQFGDGQGYFSSPVYYPTESGGDNWYVLPADLRHKGITDLVFTNYYSGQSVILNEGHGKFFENITWPIAGGAAYCAVSGDFNGDGIPDLAVTVDQGLSILLGTGKATSPYTQGQLISYSIDSCPLVGDLNRDGIPDLFVTTGDNQAVGYLGNGDGTFTQASKTTALASNGIPVLGDFNGDGKLDFALTSNLLAYGNGDGTFQTPEPYIPQVKSGDIEGIAAARLSGHELSDIVLADFAGNLVYVLLSTGHGFSETTFASPSGCNGPYNGPAIPVLADLNQDGYKDLLLGCESAEIPIYLNNGEGAFAYSMSVNVGLSVDEAAIPLVVDLNGDGILDLVAQEQFDLGILSGEANLIFAVSSYIGCGVTPGPVIAVDVQGQSPLSGKPDLITPDATGVINIFFNTTK